MPLAVGYDIFVPTGNGRLRPSADLSSIVIPAFAGMTKMEGGSFPPRSRYPGIATALARFTLAAFHLFTHM
ncbi:hypothetical protein [Sphingopyxis terrae]|uniref:hypothetical protein n=1 Tax=Sphingopyxis terrae TaxID=33052 RepID=UPI00078964A3|nr:hypothetical protein [Sphingopyxis terrae]